MKTSAMREYLRKFIESADEKVLEEALLLFENLVQKTSSSLDNEQQIEALKRSRDYKAGLVKGCTISEAREKFRSRSAF